MTIREFEKSKLLELVTGAEGVFSNESVPIEKAEKITEYLLDNGVTFDAERLVPVINHVLAENKAMKEIIEKLRARRDKWRSKAEALETLIKGERE